ncbi:putative oxidoreductase [Periconia macrospinosa]|uniref:Putative oxidoreductase n=1 Tax=Periconia macrospinosa TaxID=97972 RepID=A0A2V1D6H9_9PLEO|nr:putative oxidoreductase [Periconia macrospinosa]
MPPQLIFGTASFGGPPPGFESPQSIHSLLNTLQILKITHLDTAARYPPTNPGRSEELIGEVATSSAAFQVDTKCLVDTATDGSGDLSKERMEASVERSLTRMKRTNIDVLYAHRADPSTPLEDQIRNFNEMIDRGVCRDWGVSNFSPSTMETLLKICDEKGLRKPKYYQGVYNLIARAMETKLLPLLRAHGVAFVGYAPLAGGYLTANLANNTTQGTRFDASNPIGRILGPRFSTPTLTSAMQRFDAAVRGKGLNPIEVSLRWLNHHSPLRDEDGIILGASKEEQVVRSVEGIRRGALETEVLADVERLWRDVAEVGCEGIWGNAMG